MQSSLALRPRDTLTALLAGVCAVSLAWGAFTGCVSEPDPLPLPTGSGTTAPTENHGRELFEALQDELSAACGLCHDAGGIADTPFLAGPDVYQSVTSWPGIIVKDPAKSSFMTHAVTGGGHSGTNLDSEALKDTLLPKVQAWLEEEARGIVDGGEELGPMIDPIAPILGFNAVYLDSLGPEYKGMALTFNADELTDTLLSLSDLQLHTTSQMGVHVVHPLFVVYPKGVDPDPDPTDSFSNVDQYVDVGLSDVLGPGILILTNWTVGAKLSVAFERIEPYSSQLGTGGSGPGGGGCIDVASFTANAQGPLQNNCFTCHGGANGGATAAVDMSDLQADPAAACAQVKNRVSPTNPPASQIYVTTDPNGNAAHPYKFNGNAGAFNTFRDSTSIWVSAEQ